MKVHKGNCRWKVKNNSRGIMTLQRSIISIPVFAGFTQASRNKLTAPWMKLWSLSALRQLFQKIRNAKADRSSMENHRPHTYTSNVTTAHPHTLPGRDSVRPPDETESTITNLNILGVAETSELATPNYSKRPSHWQADKFKFSCHFPFLWILSVYYRIYAEDGAISSKTSVAPGNPFLGRIKFRSVPPLALPKL